LPSQLYAEDAELLQMLLIVKEGGGDHGE